MVYVPNPKRHTLPYLMGRLVDKDRIQGATSNINSTSIAPDGVLEVEPGGRIRGLPLEDIPVDTVPPPVPSAPALSLSIGMVDVHWDGTGAGGETMPEDFHFAAVEYRMGAEPFIAGPSISDAPGWAILPGLPAGTVEVRLVAVDTTGNRSAPGPSATLEVVPIETAEEVRRDLEEADRVAGEDLKTLNEFMESGEISLDRIKAGTMKVTTADAVFAGLAVVDRLTVGTQA
ncbi:MAG: hypothetical protein QJR09_08240, partial [Micrococcus sp.]|nr:hypothetical protein [Micrococcus sp.]